MLLALLPLEAELQKLCEAVVPVHHILWDPSYRYCATIEGPMGGFPFPPAFGSPELG